MAFPKLNIIKRPNKHIVSFSGGKDSTALLLMMIEKGMRIDSIINIDTTKEFPGMYKHIEDVKKFISPYKITTVKIDYDYWFADYILVRGVRKGRIGYGWPSFRFRWCTGMKMDAFRSTASNGVYLPRDRNQRSLRLIKDTIIYIGYSTSEINRTKDNTKREKYPLIDWEISGKQALQYCYGKGFDWSGLYEDFSRVSCTCCPFFRVKELRTMYKKYPELWLQLKEMDKKALNKFRSDYSVDELDDKFKREAM